MFPSEYGVWPGEGLRNIGRFLMGNEERWRLDAERLRQTRLDQALPGLLKQDGGFGLLPSLSDLDPRNFLVMEQEKREREELEATENERKRLRALEGMY